jgi:hypothetical protein
MLLKCITYGTPKSTRTEDAPKNGPGVLQSYICRSDRDISLGEKKGRDKSATQGLCYCTT